MYKHFIFTIIIAFMCINESYTQNKYTQKADDAFEREQYAIAVDMYKKIYSKVKRKDKDAKAKVIYKLALSYLKMNDTRQAASWLRRATRYGNPPSEAILQYANVLKSGGDYEDAIEEYRKFIKAEPNDPRGPRGVESCSLAMKWMENPTRYTVDDERRLNSRQMDFSPIYADSKYRTLIFTSAREGSKGRGTDAWTDQPFSDIYFAKIDRRGRWSSPVAFPEPINTNGNEGTACLNNIGTELYFTRCRVEKQGTYGCQIFVAKKSGKNWGDDVELLPLVEDSTINVAHPSLSDDGLELYFVSDMKGSIGGQDIWVVRRPSKTEPFGKPENLGDIINTPEDEMFPNITAENILYFSSKGHIGMGGLDIFKSEKAGEEWSEPENLKYPINSPSDDFGIIFEESKRAGFFSTNRRGGRGSDDIWMFNLPPLEFTLSGTIVDDSTKRPLENVMVKLDGTDASSIYTYTDKDGTYNFTKDQFQPNTTYEIDVTKDGYFRETGKETTVGMQENKDFTYDFALTYIPEKPIELPEILYDLAKWDLKPQYKDSLNGLVKLLKDNPNIVIELASHTDSRASDAYNDTLSQKRAQSVVDYLILKGIEPGRLVAKGYGEQKPKKLERDFFIPGYEIQQGEVFEKDTLIAGNLFRAGETQNRIKVDTILFKRGSIMTEDFIDSLETERAKELAHQLNRRTEFRVLRKDYVPKNTQNTPIPNNNKTGRRQ